jgi:hypothetical protein
MIVNGDGHPTVQTTSLYEVGDPDSVFIEVESWRPKPDLEDFERTPAPPGPGGMDCALIRRKLGLPPSR